MVGKAVSPRGVVSNVTVALIHDRHEDDQSTATKRPARANTRTERKTERHARVNVPVRPQPLCSRCGVCPLHPVSTSGTPFEHRLMPVALLLTLSFGVCTLLCTNPSSSHSGWYLGNFSAAGAMRRGRGAGCGFVTQGCLDTPPESLNAKLWCGGHCGKALRHHHQPPRAADSRRPSGPDSIPVHALSSPLSDSRSITS